MKTDGGDDGEDSRIIIHAGGNFRAQVLGDAHDVRVRPFETTRSPTAKQRSRSNIDDLAHMAISKGQRLAELRADSIDGGEQPVVRALSITILTRSGCWRAF